jgi:glycosyltransferase involved in cell wall biosynthesis
VIITRFGDNEQWVKQETAGLLFDARNAKELSQCLLKLAGSSNLRTALGQKGRQVILLENNSEIELMKILALYRKVLH